MVSAIDITKPTAGIATTASVRANFAAAKAEIEALQTSLQGYIDTGPFLKLTGGTLTGPLVAPSVTASAGTLSGMTSLGILNGGTQIGGDVRIPEAWGLFDSVGNLGPYVDLDGAWHVGDLYASRLFGTIGGSASLTLPFLAGTIVGVTGAATLSTIDPRSAPLGLAFGIADSAGNMAFAIDTAGAIKATLPAPSSVPSFTIANVLEQAMDARQPLAVYEIADASGRGGLAITREGRLAFNPAMGQISAPAQRFVKRRTLLTQGPWNAAASDNPVADPTDRTYQNSITVETIGFDAVRLVYAVDNGAGAPFDTDVSACIAVSASATDLINPVDSTGAAVPWVPVYFDNNGANVAWEKQNQLTHTKRIQRLVAAPTLSTVDGSPQTSLQGYTLSDWIPISSLDRSDGGRWPILMVRTHATGTTNGGIRYRIIPQTISGFGGQVGDRFWWNYSGAGDFVTSTQAGFAPGAADGHTILVGFQFYSRARGISLMAIGDSIIGGTGGGPGGIDWVVRAALELSRPEAPIPYWLAPTGVIQDTTPQAWVTNSENAIDWLEPSLVVFESMSRNWPATQINVDRMWQRYMQMQRRLELLGSLPIWLAPSPANMTYTAASELIRKQIIARCIQCERGGHMMWDMNPTMTQHLTPIDDWIHDYTDDSLHPNNNGHNAYAGMMVKLYREASGI